MNFYEKRLYLGKRDPNTSNQNSVVYGTPHGLYPNLWELAYKLGVTHQTLSYRCLHSVKSPHWFKIDNPTETLIDEAVDNLNNLFVERYATEDHCTLCNHIDDMIFADNCWLLEVDHDHSDTDLSDVGDVSFSYSFGGEDYTVTYKAWTNGERPHKTKEESK